MAFGCTNKDCKGLSTYLPGISFLNKRKCCMFTEDLIKRIQLAKSDISMIICIELWYHYLRSHHKDNISLHQFSYGLIYRSRAIITRGLYTFYPIFEGQKRFLGAFFVKFWPYVWLVFKSGFKSRAGYSGARTVYAGASIAS